MRRTGSEERMINEMCDNRNGGIKLRREKRYFAVAAAILLSMCITACAGKNRE